MFADIDIQSALQSSQHIIRTRYADIYGFAYQGSSYVIKASLSEQASAHYSAEHSFLSGDRPTGTYYPKHHRYLENCVIGNTAYKAAVIMDYIPGRSLQDIIRKKGFVDQNPACSVMTDVIRTLEHTNSLGYFHLDIALNNIIKDDSNGHSWLIDYTGCYHDGCDTVYHSGLLENPTDPLPYQLLQLSELFGQLIDRTDDESLNRYRQICDYVSEPESSKTPKPFGQILEYCQGS